MQELTHAVIEKIFRDHSHDLESLAPRFAAERFLELLALSGWVVVPIDKAEKTLDGLPIQGT